jgi:hypothetical protein
MSSPPPRSKTIRQKTLQPANATQPAPPRIFLGKLHQSSTALFNPPWTAPMDSDSCQMQNTFLGHYSPKTMSLFQKGILIDIRSQVPRFFVPSFPVSALLTPMEAPGPQSPPHPVFFWVRPHQNYSTLIPHWVVTRAICDSPRRSSHILLGGLPERPFF